MHWDKDKDIKFEYNFESSFDIFKRSVIGNESDWETIED